MQRDAAATTVRPATERPRLGRILVVGALVLAACAPTASAPASSASPAGSASTGGTGASGPASVPAPAAAAPPGAVEQVRFASSPAVSTAGVFIGMERGYFREVGLEVEIVPFSGGAEMISSIAASQVDAANTDAGSGLLKALARDLPMRFVADGSRCVRGRCATALVVRKELIDSGAVREPRDLRGRTVNPQTPGSTLSQYMTRVLERGGLQESDVTFQYVIFADTLAAMANRAVDASFLIEPFVTAGTVQNLTVRWYDTADLFERTQNTMIVFSPGFAAQRTEAGKRFMVGYLRGIRDYLDAFEGGKDRGEIVDILTKHSSIKDAALFDTMGMPGFDPNGELLIDALKDQQQWWVDRGILETPVDLDLIYDRSYLVYAYSVVGRR
jgi:ABC-type nitrate/sulfonate/bicarbonate transport system substrate-binding protein